VQPGSQLAVRSEDLSFGVIGAVAEGELAGVVEHVEFRGGSVGYLVQTNAGKLRVDLRSSLSTASLARGDAVSLRLPRDAHIVQGS
jgi:iron(III) transport system ATP-binding protein